MKKVLVLCQRKSGNISYTKNGNKIKTKIENTVVPEINETISSIFGKEEYKIEYLSSYPILDADKVGDTPNGEIDIEGQLTDKEDKEDKEPILKFKNVKNDIGEPITMTVKDFINKNKKSYDLILLNTCPFRLMKFQMIYDLLKDDGLMVFTAYNPLSKKKLTTTIRFAERLFDIIEEKYIIEKKEEEEDNTLFFKKKITGGKNRNNKVKRTKKYKIKKRGNKKKGTKTKRIKYNKK